MKTAPNPQGGDAQPSAIQGSHDQWRIFGTKDLPSATRHIQLGALSFLYSDTGIRRICWHQIEVVRAICWPIRNRDWGTFIPDVLENALVETDTQVSGRLKFAVADGRLVCDIELEATRDGDLRVDLAMTPVSGAFETNRAGLTVLHPIMELAGAPLQVRHSDGSEETTGFPRRISPGQPVMDIVGLSYAIGSTSVDIDFAGEVFEMEDQRNWSDASFKTYCVPLRYPFTYTIDRTITQSVQISVSGEGTANSAADAQMPVSFEPTDKLAPAIGLALEDDWIFATTPRAAIERCGASHLLIRITLTTDLATLSVAADLARQLGADVDVELVLDDDAPDVSLQRAAQKIAASALAPRRLIALPGAYLSSYQPSGPWPKGATPGSVLLAARKAFPDVQIGGGMLTNFTELNRARPDAALFDFITHGNSAIVHAADDLSVVETLEALPQIYESAQALAAGKPYRLGLVSIGMRSNPYGASVAANRAQVREAMAGKDPRHRGLFGAAWAVGVLASTHGSAVEALCLAAPSGPFGIVDDRPPGSDDSAGAVFPMFHVVRRARQLAGCKRLSFHDLPSDVVAYGAMSDGTNMAIFANVSDQPKRIHLKDPAMISVLDSSTFDAAVSDASWLDSAPGDLTAELELGPYAICFAQWKG